MIKKDEYVRTKQGTIGQIIEKYEKYCVIANTRGEIDVPYENIKKHSKNIIDLIEVGDYVNGKYVYKNGTDFGGDKCLHMESSEVYACEDFLYEDDIKSIVTKEAFHNVEYRVETN